MAGPAASEGRAALPARREAIARGLGCNLGQDTGLIGVFGGWRWHQEVIPKRCRYVPGTGRIFIDRALPVLGLTRTTL